MEKQYFDSDLGQVHYRSEGEGPLLLMMHATTHSSRMFNYLIPELADNYRVVAPDYPGFGNSDPLPSGTTMIELGECIVALIEEVGAESADLFGLHTGNKLGAAMASRNSERVDDVILCGQPHSIITDNEDRNDVIRAYVDESLMQFKQTASGAHHLKDWAHLQSQIGSLWWDPQVLQNPDFDEESIEILASHIIDRIQADGALEDIYEANFNYDWPADLQENEKRTLVLELADEGEIEEYGLQGDSVVDIVPNSIWETIEGYDVSIFHRSPEIVADHIRDFLDD